MKLQFNIDNDIYFADEASRRGVSVSRLSREILNVVIRDKMVLSILDDDGRPMSARRAARSDAGLRHRIVVSRKAVARAPATEPEPEPRPRPRHHQPQPPRTHSEMRRDLEEAVRNTVSEPMFHQSEYSTPDEIRERVRRARELGFDGARGLGPVRLSNGVNVGEDAF